MASRLDGPNGTGGATPRPRMVDATVPPSFPPMNRRAASHRGPLHVLLAEDDAEMRALLSQVLRRAGYEVRETGDGDTALAILTDRTWFPHPPDVLVSDVRMPGYDGLSVAAVIRERGLKLPIFLMTAFGDEDLHAEAERLGVRHVFDKPFDLSELLVALGDLARRH